MPAVLRDLQSEVGSWADETFPHSTPETIVFHLRDEVDSELTPEAEPEEAADVLLLLLHYAHKRDFDLISAAQEKFEVNRSRHWGEPDERGVSVHIEAGPTHFLTADHSASVTSKLVPRGETITRIWERVGSVFMNGLVNRFWKTRS